MRLAEFTRKAMEQRLTDVYVARPVRVEAYNCKAQTVDVKPLIKNLLEAEDGVALESVAKINSVPVVFPRAGGFFITFPIIKGDTGMIIVCDRSIDQWHKKGGEVEALDRRLHSFAGATFYPGLADSLHSLADAHADNLVMGKDGGAQIHVKADGIDLYEENAADFVALAGKVLTELQNIKTWADVHMHTYIPSLHPAPPAQTTPPTSAPPLVLDPMPAPDSMAATKIRAT